MVLGQCGDASVAVPAVPRGETDNVSREQLLSLNFIGMTLLSTPGLVQYPASTPEGQTVASLAQLLASF